MYCHKERSKLLIIVSETSPVPEYRQLPPWLLRYPHRRPPGHWNGAGLQEDLPQAIQVQSEGAFKLGHKDIEFDFYRAIEVSTEQPTCSIQIFVLL